MRVRVETYSGYRADERPLRFWAGEREYSVVEVVDRWYGPESSWFKVRAADGDLYILRQSGPDWTLEAFRSGALSPNRPPGRRHP